jgi:hypothetical protein
MGMAPADGGAAAGGGDAGVATVPATSDAGTASTGPTFFTDAGGATPPPALGEAALDAAIDLAITALAPKAAPKMDKEGQPGRATLKEGEHFAMAVTLQPGRCYTFIGFSPPGNITQLDLKLMGLALPIEAGRSGAGDKNAPVLFRGTTATCPIFPIATPYKVDVAATKGAGRMAVWVYSRAK